MSVSIAAVAVQKSFLEEAFEAILSKVTQVEFNSEWAHGDYFNGACAVELKPGQIVASVVPGLNARRLLMIGTRAGTLAVFERYTPNNDSPFVLVSNACIELRSFALLSGSIDESALIRLVSRHNPEDNIGSRLETVFNMTAPSKRVS
jgi:hypothetical protein